MAQDFAFRGIFGRQNVEGPDDFTHSWYSTITGMIAHQVLFGYDRINPGESYYKPVARMTKRMYETLIEQKKTPAQAQVAVMRYSRDLINLRNTLSLRMKRSLTADPPEKSIHAILKESFDINSLRSNINYEPLKHHLANCIIISGTRMNISDGSLDLLVFADNPTDLSPDDKIWLARDPQSDAENPESQLYNNLSLALAGTEPSKIPA